MKSKSPSVKAIILAAGYSRRMRSKMPKQLAEVNHKPLIAYTLDAFERCRAIEGMVLVVQHKYLARFRNLVKSSGYKKVEQLCLGGRTRQQSVFNALGKISDCDYVLIHDGVRPFVTEKIISDVIKATKQFGAATSAVRSTDSIVEERQGFIGTTLRRDRLWHIQTPQGFKLNLIRQAHRQARAKGITDASDDAQLLLKMRKKIKLIKGSYKNIKITTPEDLRLARLYLSF